MAAAAACPHEAATPVCAAQAPDRQQVGKAVAAVANPAEPEAAAVAACACRVAHEEPAAQCLLRSQAAAS